MHLADPRILIAVFALGIFFLLNRKYKRQSKTYLERFRDRQHRELEELMLQEEMKKKEHNYEQFELPDSPFRKANLPASQTDKPDDLT